MTAKEVLTFWFDGLKEGEPPPQERWQLWFGGKVNDRLIAERFGRTLEEGLAGAFDGWQGTARGALALIVLFDQFPRNIFRDSPRAYGADPRALALTRAGLAGGRDRELKTIERAFFYLPLEHAEEPEAQDLSVAAFSALLASAPSALRPACESFLDYARRHAGIIARFGRFPHRNAALGRLSTPEEEEFLRQPGSSF